MGTDDHDGAFTELHATAIIHGEYLRMLLDAGFERNEAFELVRDHHAAFSWYAHVADHDNPEPPPWLGNRPSSESQQRTGRVLSLSKPPTSEQ